MGRYHTQYDRMRGREPGRLLGEEKTLNLNDNTRAVSFYQYYVLQQIMNYETFRMGMIYVNI